MGTRRGRGEGTVYQRKDERWVAAITINGRRVTRYAPTKREAREKLTALQSAKDRGRLVVGSKTTVGDFLDRWLRDQVKPNLRPSTYRSYAHGVERLRPYVGATRLTDLKPAHIQHCYAELSRHLASATLVQTHAMLHRALSQAVKWDEIVRNPADGLSIPRQEHRTKNVLNDHQVQQLLSASDGSPYRPLWLLLITTGMRIGEALALRWDAIDWTRGTIQIRQTLRYVRAEPEFGPPKTERSRRTLKMSPNLAAELRTLYKERAGKIERAREAWEDYGVVFTTPLGRPLYLATVRDALLSALKAAELPPMRVHDLRHTAATLMMAHRVNPKIVQEIMGHSSVRMTLDLYSHVTPTMHEDTAALMDSITSPDVPSSEGESGRYAVRSGVKVVGEGDES